MIIKQLMRINNTTGCAHRSITKTSPFCSFYVTYDYQNFLSPADIDRIVEMAWEDRTPFEAIERQFGLNESEVIALMRREMKVSSFKMWRERMKGKNTKHRHLHTNGTNRFRCSRQRSISGNKISKR
jgi:uncharacterized protein (TIGR03643 family)